MIYRLTWQTKDAFIQDCIKTNKILWACAYKVNDDSLHVDLHKKPVQGIIGEHPKRRWKDYVFMELKKDGTPKLSGEVEVGSRIYADTYEESVQIYNELVQKRQDRLFALAKSCDNDFLELPGKELHEFLNEHINPNDFTPTACVLYYRTPSGQFVDICYDYDTISHTSLQKITVFAAKDQPTDKTWLEAVTTAHHLGYKYQIPVIIHE